MLVKPEYTVEQVAFIRQCFDYTLKTQGLPIARAIIEVDDILAKAAQVAESGLVSKNKEGEEEQDHTLTTTPKINRSVTPLERPTT